MIDCVQDSFSKVRGKERDTHIHIAIMMTFDCFCVEKRVAAINDRIMLMNHSVPKK